MMCVCLCVRACMRVWDGGRVCVCGGGGVSVCLTAGASTCAYATTESY